MQQFGGNWTEEKLNRIRKYLSAYSTIMNKYNFTYAYIDAFAGMGYRNLKEYDVDQNDSQSTLFLPELAEPEPQSFMDGSARIALQIRPEFDKYIFIEKDREKSNELSQLKSDFISLANKIEIVNSDANLYLQNICQKKWKTHRAVLFLDPFGMQISWETIVAIANTKAIDLWYLFPVGVAINRLLKRDGQIKESIRHRLNETFGTTDWYDAFYSASQSVDLFGNFSIEKIADCQMIAQYFLDRLRTVFAGVAKNLLLLLNSNNTPLYLLCFAAANERGAKTAIKIAQDILRN